MEIREVIVNDREYHIREDGQIILPEREYEVFREDYGKWFIVKRKARISKQSLQENGYLKSVLGLVHRAVAKAYLGHPPNPQWTVNHKDGNKTNNHYTNLEWVPHSENVKHWIYSEKGIGKKTKPIQAFTLDGELVGTYHSCKQAAEELGLVRTSVGSCLTGRLKKTGGYTFREITKEQYYAESETNSSN